MIKKTSILDYRQEFPILTRNIDDNRLIYFDNAATTQKPLVVINAFQKHYESNHANVHRASHTLSAEATLAFEKSRKKVQQFINAKSEKEIIWTKGATESINLVAQTWGVDNLVAGDEIILSYSEHHANIVPWQIIAQKVGATIKIVPLTVTGVIDVNALNGLMTVKTKLIAFTHISNVVGKANDLKKIIALAKKNNVVTLVDGAQAIAHISVDVQSLDCDFYVFSAHKMCGPNGVGVLYGRQTLLEKMPPYQGGGEMIEKVSFIKTTYADLPFKFEPGTPNISGVIAFYEAINFIDKYKCFSQNYESELIEYTYKRLNEIAGLTYLFVEKPDIPLFSFTLEETHNFDLATYLNTQGIAIRSGHHCAMPLMEYKQVKGCVRISLAPYNTFDEVDLLIDALRTSCSLNTVSSINVKKIINTSLVTESKDKDTFPHKTQRDMEAYFLDAHSWDSRHRLIMLLGKNLERLSINEKVDMYLIEGCESSAWLMHELVRDKHSGESVLIFKGDSDAKVIRGLLVIVFTAINGLSPTAILNSNMTSYFERLGLLSHLSPSRGNGLNAIVKKVMEIALYHQNNI